MQSKLPSEVLRLGARIVRELEVDQSTSTLNRWMAHHLAEVIKNAESEEGTSKDVLQEKAVRLVMDLWGNRRSLPGNAYPLSQLEDVISVIKRLSPEASPFRRRLGDDVEELLSRVFNALQVVVIHGALLVAKDSELTDDVETATPFLGDEEILVVETVKGWTKFVDKGNLRYEILSKSEDEKFDIEMIRAKVSELNELDPRTRSKRIVYGEIEGLMKTLSDLRVVLDAADGEADIET